MTLFVAAIGATVTAIVELTVGPYIRVGNAQPHLVFAQPHLVFVFAVVWTFAAGLESGLVWAFVGGIAIDVLAQRPLGTTSFALIIVVGLSAAIAHLFNRWRPIVVVPTVAILSLLYSMTLFLLLGALGTSGPAQDPIGTLMPSVAYDTVIAVLVGPLAIALHDRYVEEERVDW